MPLRKQTIIIISFFITYFYASAQEKNAFETAFNLQLSYDFAEAINAYNNILLTEEDSLKIIEIKEKIIESENGLSFLKFATTPNVINLKNVPPDDFFLSISELGDRSWISIPNPFIKRGGHEYYKAMYYPSPQDKIIFSAPNEDGNWDLFESKLLSDTLWSAPTIIENLSSPKDEIFPILSNNGKELFFASNGHYGMGGYDIYTSVYDEELGKWGLPQNLGFPFSSTSDDLLFMNTPDGEFSILASNRNLTDGSIGIYALEYSPTPIKTSLSDLGEVRRISNLIPEKVQLVEIDQITEVKDTTPEKDEYSEAVKKTRNIQEALEKVLTEQDENRELLITLTNKADLEFLEKKIAEGEEQSIKLREELNFLTKKVQEIEMDFLAKGIIPQAKIEEEIEEVVIDDVKEYNFQKLNMGVIPRLNVEIPTPKFDYSFRIEDLSLIALDQTIPNNLIYQVQLAVTSRKAPMSTFKGITPIYEQETPNGKYIYRAGIFTKYAEAKTALNQITRRGFPQAYIVALNNGDNLSLNNARSLEAKLANSVTYQIILRGYEDDLPTSVTSTLRESSDKDIAKTFLDGETVYLVGPFEQKTDAEYIVQILEGLGIEGASVEPIKL